MKKLGLQLNLLIVFVNGLPVNEEQKYAEILDLEFFSRSKQLRSSTPAKFLKFSEKMTEFQKFYHLPVTGKIDENFKSVVSQRKFCDLPDVDLNEKGKLNEENSNKVPFSSFSNHGSDILPAWRFQSTWQNYLKYPIKYNLSTDYFVQFLDKKYAESGLSPFEEMQTLIEECLNIWADVTDLRFTPSDLDESEISIKFAAQSHGDRYPFQGSGLKVLTLDSGQRYQSNTLAHAFQPSPSKRDPGQPDVKNYTSLYGDVHIDYEEPWYFRYKMALHFLPGFRKPAKFKGIFKHLLAFCGPDV